MSAIKRLLAVCLAVTSGSTARAEDEVRIAITTGVAKLEIAGDDVQVFDGDVGDLLASAKGPSKVDVRAVASEVVIGGRGLKFAPDRPRSARRMIFEAKDGLRVGRRSFIGRVAVSLNPKSKKLIAINRLGVETYLLGIVGSEMSARWPPEALKAQAVAARSYALHRRMKMRAANRPYDLQTTVLSQVYGGAKNIAETVKTAVEGTRGEVISFNHRMVEALFHSTCGGRTVSAQSVFGGKVPYLQPRICRWCEPSSLHRWQVEVPLKTLSSRLTKGKLVSGAVEALERAEGEADVRVKVGGRWERVQAKRMRRAMGFKKIASSRFSARTKGQTVYIEGRGFGHGVGMCQWGAHGLATAGRNYREILGHYYRGTVIKRIY